MKLSIVTFGHKYHELLDLDMLIDARILPNPYYVKELKEKTGLDSDVKRYVLENEISRIFLKKTVEYIEFTIENLDFKKDTYILGVACTGGQHRSVAVGEYLKEYFNEKYKTTITHLELR